MKIKPLKAGKFKLTLKSVQSSKTAKLTVTVLNYYKITFPEGVSVSYKSGKNNVTVKSGDYVPDKAKLNISGSGTIKVNGSDIKKGKFTVKASEVNITVA